MKYLMRFALLIFFYSCSPSEPNSTSSDSRVVDIKNSLQTNARDINSANRMIFENGFNDTSMQKLDEEVVDYLADKKAYEKLQQEGLNSEEMANLKKSLDDNETKLSMISSVLLDAKYDFEEEPLTSLIFEYFPTENGLEKTREIIQEGETNLGKILGPETSAIIDSPPDSNTTSWPQDFIDGLPSPSINPVQENILNKLPQKEENSAYETWEDILKYRAEQHAKIKKEGEEATKRYAEELAKSLADMKETFREPTFSNLMADAIKNNDETAFFKLVLDFKKELFDSAQKDAKKIYEIKKLFLPGLRYLDGTIVSTELWESTPLSSIYKKWLARLILTTQDIASTNFTKKAALSLQTRLGLDFQQEPFVSAKSLSPWPTNSTNWN